MKIGFLGTGNMGRPMVQKLLKADYPVSVYDIDRAAASEVEEAGAVWCDSPKALAHHCDVLITCLPLPEDVKEVMLGSSGALAGMEPGSIWIDTSTTDYHNTLKICEQAAAIGVSSLEAPVSNLSHMGVDFANTSFFVGGDRTAFEQAEAVLNTMGAISFYVGEIGQGQSVKLLTNLLFYTATVAAGEALCLARKKQIETNVAWKFLIASQGYSVALEQFMPFVMDGSKDSSCTLEITSKDMGLTVDMADELGLSLPVASLVEKRYREAARKYDRYANHLVVVELSELFTGSCLVVDGYVAPSKYGINKTTAPDNEFIEDAIGRIKPVRLHQFKDSTETLSDIQENLLKSLCANLASINKAVLEEAYALGTAMGLGKALITKVITWSVGASFWSDLEMGCAVDQFAPFDTMSIEREQTQILDPLLRLISNRRAQDAIQSTY